MLGPQNRLLPCPQKDEVKVSTSDGLHHLYALLLGMFAADLIALCCVQKAASKNECVVRVGYF